MFQTLDLFSGVGGFSLGLERCSSRSGTGGFKTVAFCEIEEFPRRVLKKHWPDVPIYKDVRELNAQRLADDGIIPDIITGGFPCQDISVAGKQGGIEAERSGLWDELCRLIGDIRPRFAIVENVSNLLAGPSEQRGGWFGKVLGDLAEIGFDAEWEVISAKDVGCPHLRERVWIVANSQRQRGPGRVLYDRDKLSSQAGRSADTFGPGGAGQTIVADTEILGIQGHGASGEQEPHAHAGKKISLRGSQRPRPADRPAKPRLGRDLLDGLPTWMDEPDIPRVGVGIPDRSKRLKGIGNAIVPQIATLIGQAILDVEIPKH